MNNFTNSILKEAIDQICVDVFDVKEDHVQGEANEIAQDLALEGDCAEDFINIPI